MITEDETRRKLDGLNSGNWTDRYAAMNALVSDYLQLTDENKNKFFLTLSKLMLNSGCGMAKQMAKVGFIGIGLMGLPMCTQLLSASVALTVFNRNKAKCQPLVELGAKTSDSLQQLAESVDVIMMCVSNTDAVQLVVEQLEPFLKDGQIIIDFSSIAPDATVALAKQVGEKGVTWIDSPVSGGVAGAEEDDSPLSPDGVPDSLKEENSPQCE